MKIEQAKNKEPRLEKGPIIVSIDTSKSMKGRPHDLAVCLLMQLLKMARKQKRKETDHARYVRQKQEKEQEAEAPEEAKPMSA